MLRAYHFVNKTLRNGAPVPPDGEWLTVDPKKLKMCYYGLHASEHPFDALNYAPGFTLCLVDLDGEILTQGNKVCAEKRRIVKRIDAKALTLKFARDCASDVLHLWNASQIVKDFLATGENADAAAAYNAYAAAYAAANAAYAAAANAAYAASTAAKAAHAAYAAYAAANAAHAAANAAYAAYAAANAAYPAAEEKYRGWFKERVDAEFNKGES